jgi:hypothetical protein
MANENREAAVKEFYKALLEQLSQQSISGLHQYLGANRVGYVELGSIQNDGTFDLLKLKRIKPSDVPSSVIDSFNRHLWYSRHSLSDICVVRFSIKDQNTFAIYIFGYVDDGWDNGCILLEVYDMNGDLLGTMVNEKDWISGKVEHYHYFHKTPEYGSQAHPIWNEDTAQEIA